MLNHYWHGNVRELRNLIERIAILQPDTKDKMSNIIKECVISNFLKIKNISFVFLISELKSLNINKFLFLTFSEIKEAMLCFFSLLLSFLFLYANSPFENRSLTGFYSYRNKVWQNTSRGGIMPIAFEQVSFEKYFESSYKYI